MADKAIEGYCMPKCRLKIMVWKTQGYWKVGGCKRRKIILHGFKKWLDKFRVTKTSPDWQLQNAKTQSRHHLLPRECLRQVSLHAWQKVTTVRGQILSYWWDLQPDLNVVAVGVPTPYTVPLAFLRQILSGIQCWNKLFFCLIQVQVSCLKQCIITAFVFFHWDRTTQNILIEHRMVHFPSSPDFFPTACATVSSIVWELTRHSKDTFF